MDRRQQKTREALFSALHRLLTKRGIFKITVQDLLDEANVGRSTFYAHFETKEEMLREFSRQVFSHVFADAMPVNGLYDHTWFSQEPGRGIANVLYALRDNKERITEMLTCSCEEGGMFLQLFQQYIRELMAAALEESRARECAQEAQGNEQLAPFRHGDQAGARSDAAPAVPDEFLVYHVAGSFVNMIQWWIQKNKMAHSPEEMAGYFEQVVGPLVPRGFVTDAAR